MKIYTKSGDAGQTGLFGGPRVEKHHPRIEAYGDVDELNAAIGVARSASPPTAVDELLRQIQNELFTVGAELASPKPQEHGLKRVAEEHVKSLEEAIDRLAAELPALKEFVLPGGAKSAATLHLARTICRRAERRVCQLADVSEESVSSFVVKYLNRLSDLLFVMARYVNHEAGEGDVPWRQS